ncbi:MAG: aminotransferase class V-fold PLP-dependent enzyme [Bacteroidales bacterium]|nr:aminotransferase class V-fold PLP-dependent enzyme [Bacteroidales bacterium]
MEKYNLMNDYSEGCHHSILELLAETNDNQQDGYGEDIYSQQAKKLIKKEIKNPKAEIYFVTGGTQANLIVISAMLKPHESVISAETGHINIHEAGAIEATGHKINPIYNNDGKVKTQDIQNILDEHITVPHMVKPKMVYISNSTEIGTVYKKNELEKLSEFCKKNNLYLFLDGARLGSALASTENDLTLADVSKLTDVFYIGGTKNGALLGEAIVINNKKLQEDFPFQLKQKGALMSKGRLLGVQFMALFSNNLFFDLAKHANFMAKQISDAIKQKGYSFLIESPSNQIFPIFPNILISKLDEKFGFYIWKKIDAENSAVRIVTSWATNQKIVNEFISCIEL